MPKFLKTWKWQCLLGAPLLLWFYIQWTTWMYDTMIALGWTHGEMDGPVVAACVLTVGATLVFLIAYISHHDPEGKVLQAVDEVAEGMAPYHPMRSIIMPPLPPRPEGTPAPKRPSEDQRHG